MLVRRFLICLSFFSLVVTVYPQVQLPDLASFERSPVMNEQFTDNSAGWITDNQYISGRLEEGQYIIKCKNYKGSTGLSCIAADLDQSKDFEIEGSFRIIKGSGGLVFGMAGNYNHYRVEINSKNDLFVVKNSRTQNKNDFLYTGIASSQIKSGLANKITIDKIGNRYYLFINDSFIKDFANIRLEGNLMGFNVATNSEISIGYLKVSYLNKKGGPVLALNDQIKRSNSESITSQDKESRQITDTKSSTSSNDPIITWISPSGTRTQNDQFTVRVSAQVKSTSEIESVVFYVNGSQKGEAERHSSSWDPLTYIIEKTISLMPGENNIYFLVTNVKKASVRSENRYLINPEATKPVIAWKNPEKSNVTISSDMLNVEACIKSPSGLKLIKIMVNGESQGEDNLFTVSNDPSCNIKWQHPIILKEGIDNSIYIIAENSAGAVTSENRIIKYSRAVTEKRIALVIGNSIYGSRPPLKNPVNDANLMEGTLKGLGFTVIKRLNLSLDSMKNSIREFSRLISDYNVALFYYAGHGVQVENQNYLIPVNAKLEKKEDTKWETFAVNDLLEEFARQPDKINIAIFDACRSDPFTNWARGGQSGFSQLTNTTGTFVSFATAPGSTAADGDSGNGLFTEELVKQMDIVQPISSVFMNTRIAVYTRSNKTQRPQEWNDLNGEFYFKK